MTGRKERRREGKLDGKEGIYLLMRIYRDHSSDKRVNLSQLAHTIPSFPAQKKGIDKKKWPNFSLGIQFLFPYQPL